MSRIWKFSPASHLLLKRCLDAAAPYDSANKWAKTFGLKNNELANRNNTIININDSPDAQDGIATDEKEDVEVSCNFEDIFDDDTIMGRLDVLQEESMKNPKLLTKLAENLSLNTIESLFQVIFDSTDKNKEFVSLFLEYFLPVFIRRDNSRLCTDVLLKTYNIYPEYFKNVLKIVMKDVHVHNNVLNDFILTLNEVKVTEFMNNFVYIELSPEEFVHNLFSIYTAYKTCTKSENTQNYIFNCLIRYSKFCMNDKNYGRLLLTYLQSVSCMECKTDRINAKILGELVENHRSAFKRPCSNILKEINEK